jgi:hypothetical protein
MTKADDKLKSLLKEINEDHQTKIDQQLSGHQTKIDQQLSGIFLFGFLSGVVFSYTGFMGFVVGFSTGLVIRNSFSKKSYETIEKVSDIFFNILNKAKIMLNVK